MTEFKQLGRYHIESHLGIGAFADVYKATDTILNRVVALKVLKPMLLADSEAFARFTREAQVAANLFHPHIATVLDMGETEGRYFIAMRYVDGKSLDKVLAKHGALPWEQALKVTEQIGGALQFAHDKGLVHRDVKPQNIIVSEIEGAVLTDFGLVKALHSSGMTSTTSMIGTPAYVPPEIWEGEEAGPASDQYALACVLVEMLTGKVLFGGKTPPAVMARHFKPPEWPATWSAGVPANIAVTIEKALDQEPKDRYPSNSEFMVALCKSDPNPARAATTSSRKPLGIEGDALAWLETLAAKQGANPDEMLTQPKVNPAGIEWIEIPAGEFLYGENNDKFNIRKPFLIGKYPVTQAQYQRFIDANPDHPVPFVEAEWSKPYNWDKKKRQHPADKSNHPVVLVSWNDVQEFCQWAKCRLPIEFEWEKAARGTDGRKYPWGNDWLAGKYCNSAEAKLRGTTPVDEFPEGVSPYGVWDMSGNVWEWTASPHEKGGYVLRGGSWYYYEDVVRSAYRFRFDPDDTYLNVGFRCARSH